MSIQRIASINAALFFVVWLLILLAGADFPPPRGFIWIIVTIAASSAVVYWRVPAYIEWAQTGRSGRYWRVVLDGVVAAGSAGLV